MKEKHISHIRNLLAIIEDKGYAVSSIRWNEETTQIEVIIDHPYMAGNTDFLLEARDNAEKD